MDQALEGVTFTEQKYCGATIKGREFQECVFEKCDFSNSELLFDKFIDCAFHSCNFSNAKLTDSTFVNGKFQNCKLLGVHFDKCHDFLFSVSFDACVLDYSSFAGKKMLKTPFRRSSLKEVNFSQASLAGAIFDNCDLSGAIFNRTDLTSANFATATNYILDPELNTIKKASFALHGLPGLVAKYGIKITL